MELAFSKLKKIEKEMAELVEKMSVLDDKDLVNRYSLIQETYENLGGYEYKYQIHQMLAKFGFDESYYDRALKTFSGGERTRASFVKLIKAFPVTLNGLRDFREAIITKGGVKVNEVNPSTMESKKVKNLYFCGEVLDLDALTGGYNLQIAWSTGHLAGISVE